MYFNMPLFRNLQRLFPFFFLIYLFNLFIFGCVGSSLLSTGFPQLQRAGATLRCGARASHCGGFSLLQSTGCRCTGFSSCGVQAPVVVACGPSSCGSRAQSAGSVVVANGLRAQAQQLWQTGLVAPQHVGSSRTRARTRVPCTGRRILTHCPVPISYSPVCLTGQKE